MGKFKAFAICVAVFSTIFTATVFAMDDTVILLNGIEVDTEVGSVIENGTPYVPLRAIAERIGCTVTYEEATKHVILNNDAIAFRMMIDGTSALYNGEDYTLKNAPKLSQNRILVPVEVIADLFKSDVRYEASPDGASFNKVIIFTTEGVKTKSGIVLSAIIDAKSEGDIKYHVNLPAFDGLADAAFQNQLNTDVQTMYEGVEAMYKTMLDQKSDYPAGAYQVWEYEVIDDKPGMLSIQLNGEEYLGGAHGTPYSVGCNIDVKNSKLLELKDLFVEGADYKAKLIEEIEKIMKAYPALYEGVEVPTEIKNEDMFLMLGDYIVVYYSPYDLAPFARGYVYFNIRKADLSDVLNNDYK